jgi:4-hydroxy-tetrahydrodipicolinate reductase
MFFKLNEQLARMMNQFGAYEVSVDEVHHAEKKDAPSGTAITRSSRSGSTTCPVPTW